MLTINELFKEFNQLLEDNFNKPVIMKILEPSIIGSYYDHRVKSFDEFIASKTKVFIDLRDVDSLFGYFIKKKIKIDNRILVNNKKRNDFSIEVYKNNRYLPLVQFKVQRQKVKFGEGIAYRTKEHLMVSGLELTSDNGDKTLLEIVQKRKQEFIDKKNNVKFQYEEKLLEYNSMLSELNITEEQLLALISLKQSVENHKRMI